MHAPALPYHDPATVEQEILWLHPEAKNLPFVRESTRDLSRRRGAPKAYPGRIYVAIANLSPKSPSGVVARNFQRRAWYVNASDFTEFPHGGYVRGGMVTACPSEGVLPSSIAPNEHSEAAWPSLSSSPVPVPVGFGAR